MENWGAVAARGLLGKRGLPELDLRALTAMCGEFTGGKDVLHAALIESEPRLSGSDSPRSLGPVLLSPLIRRVATGRSDRSSILPDSLLALCLAACITSGGPRKAHECIEQSQTTASITTSDTLTAAASLTAVRCNSLHCYCYAPQRRMPSRAASDPPGATTFCQCCQKLIR